MHQPPNIVSNPLQTHNFAELHHRLRSALAAANLSLETFQMLGRTATEAPGALRPIERALSALQEALRIAEEIRAAEVSAFQSAANESELSPPDPPA